MHVLLLGSAAGGGFPQWNCWCPTCRAARDTPARAHPRTQSSMAVSADGTHWFLCNASPDVREQLTRLPPAPVAGTRRVPIDGIVVTDAEIDHTLGVALLREGRDLHLYATAAVLETLEHDTRILPVTRAFARVEVTTLRLGEPAALINCDGSASGLHVEAFAVAGDPPRFASNAMEGHTVGLMIVETASGARCAFVPGCGALDEPLLDRLAQCDLVLLDGTFWSDGELVQLGIGDRSARAMGHLPISGADGSLERYTRLPVRHKVYTHINNTNPVLLADSPERRAVMAAGAMVGDDGDSWQL
ncbi:MAG TPA: pyrroloquinoline quinone biosynthesis protein PqqB [Gemmatimonadaceae bacterium]|nr:pyrroloquinoline quinone biosynthesis protein PqqB [Gemmatimonadaceae bacterium]